MSLYKRSNHHTSLSFLPLLLMLLMSVSFVCSCYHNSKPEDEHDALPEGDSIAMADSISFYSTHHYSVGYNFIVHSDSLLLIAQQPEEHVSQLVTDTFSVLNSQQVAVTDIRIIPQDSIDSVWVQLINDEGRIGWLHETDLLPHVVPTDPISQFIMFFSDMHLLFAIVILVIISVAYLLRYINRRNAPMVHLRDIPSFYPTLLCVIVACSATFYASLQMFGTDTWRHFYYHPSLNPFTMPPILAIFITSVWAMMIVGIAAVEDTRHHLNANDTILYICGLIGFCAILYIIFSISTLYYIGYPLLCAYCYYAINTYLRNFHQKYQCGNCGKRIPEKGKCPYCGAVNE